MKESLNVRNDATVSEERSRAEMIVQQLRQEYPEARCGLHFRTPFELLIATILSAQCTDKRVNEITDRLFAQVRTPAEILEKGEKWLRDNIRECGLFRNKSKNIIETCQKLLAEHGGEVPADFASLVKLPGVGRKTANVVLSNAFEQPALAVDTHVFRVSNRLGLAKGNTTKQVEEGLKKVIPEEKWSEAHHLLIHHGRNICKARRPHCEVCPVCPYCEYGQKRGL